MSLTQTYYIAASARTKLGREASRPDHDLRLLVGHANLLDALMVELHDAEREQEAWFNQTVRKASSNEEKKHIQWADTIVEETEMDEEDDNASDTSDDSDDSDDSYDDEDFEMSAPLKRIRSSPVMITSHGVEDDDEEFYDDEDDEEHALARTPSHSPPELVDDSDSEDDSPPSSPPQLTLDFTAEQQRQAIATTGFFDEKQASLDAQEQAAFIQDGYFIPERTSAQLIAAY